MQGKIFKLSHAQEGRIKFPTGQGFKGYISKKNAFA